MTLTREQAIAEFRKEWNYIADKIKKEKKALDICDLKYDYCIENGFKNINADCFLCEYDSQEKFSKFKACEKCPVKVEKDNISCLGGLYHLVCVAESWKEQAALARKIANLPERTDV